jgi:uncharacterized membrane protein YuzA (DUF378 family)
MIRTAQGIAIVLLIIGALNCGFIGFLRINMIERLLGKNLISRILHLLIGASALYLAFNRDTYLPFLGETVFPESVLQTQTPAGATRTVKVRVKPRTKIVYWASEPTDNINKKPYNIAYGKYENAGVTTSDASGVAFLKVREPQMYDVPFQTLAPHVHYRVVKTSGMFGPVRTIQV